MAYNMSSSESSIRLTEKAFLSGISVAIIVISFVGNLIVLQIFRTQIQDSTYRLFAMFLALFDIGSALAYTLKTQNRVRNLHYRGRSLMCPIGNYIGYTFGFATIFMVLLIAVERYKKICTPFKSQITVVQSKVTCVVSVLVGATLGMPVLIIYGKRSVQVGNINATRCSVSDEFSHSIIPIIYFTLLNVVTALAVFAMILIMLKVRAVVSRQSALKQKRKQFQSLINRESGNSYTSLSLAAMARKPIDTDEKTLISTITDLNSSAKKAQNSSVISYRRCNSNPREEERRVIKITVTFSIISALLIISFQTFLVFCDILAVSRYFYPVDEISSERDLIIEYIPDVVIFNGAVNPFVYYLTDAKFKDGVKTVFKG